MLANSNHPRECPVRGTEFAIGKRLGFGARRSAQVCVVNYDLPLPTRYELVIDIKSAKKLGLSVPNSMQLQADIVIE